MDRYELKEDLGNGSFGRVIKARHVDTGNIVSSRLHIYINLKFIFQAIFSARVGSSVDSFHILTQCVNTLQSLYSPPPSECVML